MDTSKKIEIVADDVVVTIDYTLTVDGEVIDSSDDSEPIAFLQGHENIIPGLEREMYGMKVGDSKKVVVAAKDAYGEIDPEAFMDVARSEFPPEIPLEKGVELQMRNEDDEEVIAMIDSVSDDKVKLDFNHPLAGKELQFDVTVIELRAPTEEELEHGHIHMDDDMDEYDDEDVEYFDFELDGDDLEDEDDEEDDEDEKKGK